MKSKLHVQIIYIHRIFCSIHVVYCPEQRPCFYTETTKCLSMKVNNCSCSEVNKCSCHVASVTPTNNEIIIGKDTFSFKLTQSTLLNSVHPIYNII